MIGDETNHNNDRGAWGVVATFIFKKRTRRTKAPLIVSWHVPTPLFVTFATKLERHLNGFGWMWNMEPCFHQHFPPALVFCQVNALPFVMTFYHFLDVIHPQYSPSFSFFTLLSSTILHSSSQATFPFIWPKI